MSAFICEAGKYVGGVSARPCRADGCGNPCTSAYFFNLVVQLARFFYINRLFISIRALHNTVMFYVVLSMRHMRKTHMRILSCGPAHRHFLPWSGQKPALTPQIRLCFFSLWPPTSSLSLQSFLFVTGLPVPRSWPGVFTLSLSSLYSSRPEGTLPMAPCTCTHFSRMRIGTKPCSDCDL